jgi:hypothetical protein
MRFLIRIAFWMSIVLILLPSAGSQAPAPGPQVSATEAVSAATAAVSDVRQFCTRQPDVCTVGGQAAVALGHRAQAGAKMLYEFLHDRLGPDETGSVGKPAPVARTPSKDTLKPSDLAPAWRGPEPQTAAAKNST